MYFRSMIMCWTSVICVEDVMFCELFCDLSYLCTFVMKDEKTVNFLENILWWQGCYFHDENCHVLWQKQIHFIGCHVAHNCDNTWGDENDPRGKSSGDTWLHKIVPCGTSHVICHITYRVALATSPVTHQRVTQSHISRRWGHATWHSL